MCKSLQQTLHLIMKHWEATENAVATSNQHWTGGPSSCSKSRKGINVYWLKNRLDTYLPFPSQTPFLFSLEVAMWPSSSQWNEEEAIYALPDLAQKNLLHDLWTFLSIFSLPAECECQGKPLKQHIEGGKASVSLSPRRVHEAELLPSPFY